MLAIGRTRTKGAFGFGTDIVAAHELGHAIFTAGDLHPPQLPSNARAAVGLAALFKDSADLLQELLVGLGAWSGNLAPPSVVATAGDFQYPAEAANRIFRRQGADHDIPFCDCFEESMPRDFFWISLYFLT